jgi:hypothetical protein
MCGYDCAGRYPHRLPFTSMVWAFLLVPSRLLSLQKKDAHQKSDGTILKRQGSVSPALVFTLQSGASFAPNKHRLFLSFIYPLLLQACDLVYFYVTTLSYK